MWKALVILGLAVAAMALPLEHEKSVHEQTFRIGAVGLSFANVKGYFVPITPVTAKGVPAFEFKSILNGAPVPETDFINFRCNHVSDIVVTPDTPLLMCRSMAFEKEDAPPAEKMFFLISALNLPVTPNVNELNLSFGRTFWNSLTAPDAVATDSNIMTVRDGVTQTMEDSRKGRFTFIPG